MKSLLLIAGLRVERSAQHEAQVELSFDHAKHNAFGAAVVGKDLRFTIAPKQTGG